MKTVLLSALVACLCLWSIRGHAAGTSGTSELPRVFLLDAKHLRSVKQEIQNGSTNHAAALADLEERAKEALTEGPFSVTTKSVTPPSGDKHDYMSQGPYWWPNPNTSNGLPYIRRDGETNPEIRALPDHDAMGDMTSNVETLALAYYFLGHETYAQKAAQLLRAWFLDSETRMNPNLQFGQRIPGITLGRGIGLIETRGLTRLTDAIGLLAGSKAWTEADQKGLEKWFSDFLQWMIESRHGRDEAAAKNNHGTYYDVQVAAFALFVGKDDLARTVLAEAAQKRIAAQVEPDGRQPEELSRTRSWSYSTMNLHGLMTLAILGEKVGVDLWNFQTEDGRGIRKALDFLVSFAGGEKEWPYRQISGRAGGGLQGLLRLAAARYPNNNYGELLSMPGDSGRSRRSGRNSLLQSAVGSGEKRIPAPRVFLLDADALRAMRQRIVGGEANADELSALEKLKQDAANAMTNGPYSVMNKSMTPPSGDKHDYMSMGPYWWPNPATSNGLPYIRRDGERNPEIFKIPNRLHLGQMTDDVDTLAFAYYFTGDETAAGRAALLLRTWFLDPATRMNPHLEYGQAIPGITIGRGIGIIETRALTRIVDAIGLLADSKSWTVTDQKGMQEWYANYLQWMLESSHGKDEAAAKNNHGTYYDVQVASFALFLGKKDLAREILSAAGTNRFAVQIEPDGKQPLELDRTRAWSYSVGNLAGFMSLAKLGEHVGVDLWQYETADGRSIRKALDFLLPYGLGEKWPYLQIDGLGPELFHPVLRLAALKYPDAPYRELLSRLPRPAPDSRGHLLLSPLEPVNRLHLPRNQQTNQPEEP